MKITALIENTAPFDGVETEHGLSLYIETEKHNILFDMGQTDMFLRNADRLGKDISAVDLAVLSHGHYDHGGGLGTFLEKNKNAPVFVSRYAFGEYYNGTEKYIGLDKSMESCKRLIFIDSTTVIGEGITLYTDIPGERRYHPGSFGLKELKDGKFCDDAFLHEQYLEICENGKRVLISGCSHRGIADIALSASPDVLIGGFHFSKLPTDEKLCEYALVLNSVHAKYYTCHCTGAVQYDFMKQFMDDLHYLACTESIEI